MLTFFHILLWVVVGILLISFLYIFLIPIKLRIDTRDGFVTLIWGPVASGGLYWQAEDLAESEVRFKMLFINKRFKLLELLAKSKEKESKSKKKSGFKLRALTKGNFGSAVSVLKSFKVSHFELMIDTGDYCLNGMLIPINYLNPLTKFPVTINFIGKNYLVCDIQNSGIRVLQSFIKHKMQ